MGTRRSLVIQAMTSADWKEAWRYAVPQGEASPTHPPGSHGICNPVLSQRSQLKLTVRWRATHFSGFI